MIECENEYFFYFTDVRSFEIEDDIETTNKNDNTRPVDGDGSEKEVYYEKNENDEKIGISETDVKIEISENNENNDKIAGNKESHHHFM